MRRTLSLLLCLLSPATLVAAVDSAQVPVAKDLSRVAAEARRLGVPVMLEFAASDCPYCRVLEEQVLGPMLRGGADRGRVLVRMLELDSSGRLRDFDGRPISAQALGRRYAVKVTPTLVFLDSHGNDLGGRIVGVWSLDYFGGFVDQAIAAARDRLDDPGSGSGRER